MPDTEDSTEPAGEITKPRPPRVRSIWGISYIKRQFQERCAKYQQEAPADRSARRTANATYAIAAFTVVLAYASVRTLDEIHSGGKDTHDLAVAAGKQADAAKALADQAKTQTEKMTESVKAANRLAEASQKQAITADKTLTVAAEVDRPWMAFQSVTVSPPITEGKISDIALSIVNAGRRPAHTLAFRVSANVFDHFPAIPPYSLSPGESSSPSQSIIIPGTGVSAPFKGTAYPTPMLDRITRGDLTFYVYAIVTYQDLGTGKAHTTKICQFFIPSKSAYGWCPEYNDAN